jgi:hypothetical protein
MIERITRRAFSLGLAVSSLLLGGWIHGSIGAVLLTDNSGNVLTDDFGNPLTAN